MLYAQLSHLQRENVFPHITLNGWWECDMFCTTKAGYWHEFEIKVSRADFFKDFDKKMAMLRGRRRSSRFCGVKGVDTLHKHAMMEGGDERGPSYYWFCIPEGLVEESEIPDYAGLIEFPEPAGKKPSPYWRGYMNTVRKAPKLHKMKISQDRLEHLQRQIPYRYQAAYFEKIPKLLRQIDELKAKLKD